MKTTLIIGVALSAIGTTLLGNEPSGAAEQIPDVVPLIGQLIGWLLVGSGACLLTLAALSKQTEKERWFHEYQPESYASGIAAGRDSDSDSAPAPQLHRRHLFDRHRTDWTLRGR
jgi:hypothetical protein